MKKVLNVFGIIFAVITTMFLTCFIISYVFISSAKYMTNEKGLEKFIEKVDVVATIKEDEQSWNEMVDSAQEIGIDEQQLEELLNSGKIKEELAAYLNKIIESVTSDETISISTEELRNTISVAIDEYNKVSDQKITEEEKEQLINEIVTEQTVAELNDSLSNTKINDSMTQEDETTDQLVNSILFGKATTYMMVSIIIMVALIALFRFSYYKWMPYVGVSTAIATLSSLSLARFFNFADLIGESDAIVTSLMDVLKSHMMTSSIVLLVLTIALFVGHYFLKKLSIKPQTQETTV